jgi:abhydrolase domain-containing protein 2
VYLLLHDGSTLTYDLYQPLNATAEDDITVAICPGIGNSSESVYIRTFVHYAQCHGYRCAVLNHIGVLDSVQVTSHRIFAYGKLAFPPGLKNHTKLVNQYFIQDISNEVCNGFSWEADMCFHS